MGGRWGTGGSIIYFWWALWAESSEVVTNCHRLKLEAPDSKMRETDCANTKGMFRIIQSIPSYKAEPFK